MWQINLRVYLVYVVVSLLIGASNFPCWGALVFSALHHGSWKVYFQIDLVSPPQLVAAEVFEDGNASALAPDEQRVAFEVQGIGVYVCPVNSSSMCEIIRPSSNSAVRPAWHQKTGELIFVNYLVGSGHEDSDLMIAHGGMGKSRPLLVQTGNQDYPDISPDGRLLAYTVSHTISLHQGAVQVIQQLWVMDLTTGLAQQLLLSDAQDTHPDWAPSGQEIAFASNRTGQFEIWIVNADGTDLRQVTSGLGAKTWPAWSPDGKSIMFTLSKDGHQNLWIINVDSTYLRAFEPFGPHSSIELRDADWH